MADEPDVVIVGAGIAGGALATVLARGGLDVLVLERALVHRDRVRGEFLAPWGVAEAGKLGLLDVLARAGTHYTVRTVPYRDGLDPEAARARATDLSVMLPGIAGAVTVGHPRLCEALDAAACEAGATLLRGASELSVEAGERPRVGFTHDGHRREVSPRLVVGADGRGSAVARYIGLNAETDPIHHIMAGLLVEGAEAWPEDEQTFGAHSGATLYVFPQGGGRVRLYVNHTLAERRRYAGPDAARNFLAAFNVPSLPFGEALAAARPIGPCHGYPNADSWIDEPVAPGVVLIGDAAGHNDPTIGQGLSITLRDVRLVSEAMLEGRFSAKTFKPYVEERRERMRRLRFIGRLFSTLHAEFTEEAHQRRQRAWQRTGANPAIGLPILAILKGPDALPSHAFEQEAWDRLLA
ncbi:NAD(P)/FAD-dependent oxidoreductase [Sabulicella rubraurantiaca]|uniref:NAD(P)/FAD-dependent oxidoreductase n=1 Tax=Sabulicella rubraurantiaca TaxID=2811429 RepID=UPI001A96181C|nr:FAD-dependent monooxygenase [Sabulicella rubraurantiaca]